MGNEIGTLIGGIIAIDIAHHILHHRRKKKGKRRNDDWGLF
jgi:ethanolamine transporter EutH